VPDGDSATVEVASRARIQFSRWATPTAIISKIPAAKNSKTGTSLPASQAKRLGLCGSGPELADGIVVDDMSKPLLAIELGDRFSKRQYVREAI
jgi:hypothetical protein